MKVFIVILFTIPICPWLCSAQNAEEEYPRVITPLGTIEGIYKNSSEGKKLAAYLGIPYALPPIGERRFEIATPIAPWNGVLSAKAFGSSCLQVEVTSVFALDPIVSGSEDCLFLNVFTPAMEEKSKVSTDLLPVILFIHGGGFQFGGAALYGPDYILNENVVFVTINYRLGPLGFLSTEDDTVPGNMGLKDQVIAMRWVKDNIEYFGGDPENVSLVGQSAGAVSVHYHYLTNVTAGLFQRGMSISGNALNPWTQTENSLEKAKKLATILECPSDTSSSMIECLKTRPGDKITLITMAFLTWFFSPITPFGPVVENGRSELTFIDRSPIESITTGRVQDRPWIMTALSEEGLFPGAEFVSNETRIKELNDNWAEIAPHMLDFNYTIPESDKRNTAMLIREHYLGSSPIDNSTLNQVVKLLGDRLFLSNAEKAARLQAKATKSPVRFYYFSYRGTHSVTEVLTGTSTSYGVCHLDDLAYVLYSYFDARTTDQDREMQKVMANLWVSYATEGIPDVEVEWPALAQDEEFRYLHIAGPNDIYMEENSNFGNKNFWNSIPFNENVIPLKN